MIIVKVFNNTNAIATQCSLLELKSSDDIIAISQGYTDLIKTFSGLIIATLMDHDNIEILRYNCNNPTIHYYNNICYIIDHSTSLNMTE